MKTSEDIRLLRVAIDSMPVLFSARLSDDYQAIVNEVNASFRALGKVSRVTIEDVRVAMSLWPVRKPQNVRVASVRLVGVGGVR